MNNNHLNEEELNRQLIEEESLAKERLNHFKECPTCQGENAAFLEKIKQVEVDLCQENNGRNNARRLFWTTTCKNKRRGAPLKIAMGVTICLLVSFFFSPLTSLSPEDTALQQIQDPANDESPSLLQFASDLNPDFEFNEPELISLFQYEEEEVDEQFSEFIQFIS